MIEAAAGHALKCDLAADVIRGFGTLRLRVNGFSMLPSIWPGDVVSVSTVDRDPYQPGDVVLYTRNGRLFVHRLVEMTGEAAVTRGDALPDPDPPVRSEDLLGRVVSIERRGSPIALPREVSWRRRLVGAVLSRSGRLVRVLVTL